MTWTAVRLIDVKVGDIVLDETPVLRRIPRTMRYVCTSTTVEECHVVAAASPDNGWRVTIHTSQGERVRDGQFLNVKESACV